MVVPPAPRFGLLLRSLRIAAGMTQEALAERARTSKRGLQDIERGVSRSPRRATVELLATALALAPAERAALLAAAQPPRDTPAGAVRSAGVVADSLVPLVGRMGELALLDRFLAGRRDPLESAPLLLLVGEPGIGKTRLLQAAAQEAIARGWCVLVGGCSRRGGQEPYEPLLSALAQHLQAAGPTQQRVALTGCAWLTRLLPELAEIVDPPVGIVAPEQERRLIYAAVSRLLANIAGPAGTLLVLDDLQWAGPDALDLLYTLVRGNSGPPRLVGAYRDTEVGPTDPLGLLVADLAQARLVRQQALGPLNAEEAATLLDDLLIDTPGSECDRVERALQRAGGSPFALVSYAQALREDSAETVPWSLAQGLRRRIALLPPAGQEILGAAAIVGRRLSRTLLAAVTEGPEDALPAGLQAACRAHLLLEDGDDAYVFAHDVIREVVEEDLGAARRAALHRRVAAALEGAPGGAPAELLAYHHVRGDASHLAVPYLERAGDHAWTQRAHGAAEQHYSDVLLRLEGMGRAVDAARVREKLGDVFKQTGRYRDALRVLEPAAESWRAVGDLDALARVTAGMGEVYAMLGTPDEGIARLLPLARQLDRAGAPPALAPLYMRLGMLLFTAGRYEECLAAGERAADLARAAGDERSLVQAARNRANILQMLGRLEEAMQADIQVLVLAEELGDLECLIAISRNMAYIHTLRGAFEAGRRCIDQSLALPGQSENAASYSFTLAMRSGIATLAGDWTGAHADLDQARGLSSRTDRSWHTAYLLIFAATLSLAEGALANAAASANEALALAERSGDLQALRWAARVMAEIDILEERPEAARARLVALLDRPGLEECDVTVFLPLLAWAYLELGQVDAAAATVEQAMARARPEGMRLVLVEALWVRAMIALRRGQPDEAGRSLKEGIVMARAMPYPQAEARFIRIAEHLDSAKVH